MRLSSSLRDSERSLGGEETFKDEHVRPSKGNWIAEWRV